MDRKSRLKWLIAPLAGLIATFSLVAYAYGHSLSPVSLLSINTTVASGSILTRNVIVPLSIVNQLFPEMTHETSTGINLTAVGNPKATRSVIYATDDGSKKVTITVDQYESLSDASSAYQQAIQKSKLPGFMPLSIPNLGEQSFAGTVTIDTETHIGLGVLDGNLIVGVTLAGYDASPNSVTNLVTLARIESATAKTILNANE